MATSRGKIYFLLYQPNPSRQEQEQELTTSIVKTHVARVAQCRKRASARESKDSRLRTMKGLSDPKALTYSLRAMHGNSDPFTTLAIQITPRVNEIMRFASDLMAPSPMMHRLLENSSSDPIFRNALAMAIRRNTASAWDEMLLDMRDELAGLSRILAHAGILSRISPTSDWIEPFIAQGRMKAFSLLQSRVRTGAISPNLARQILGFFQLACVQDDIAAVQVHGAMLRTLFEEHAACTEPLLMRALTYETDFAVRNAQRSQFDISPDGWCCYILEPMWRLVEQEWPMTPVYERDIHENVFTQKLRNLIIRARHSVDLIIGKGCGRYLDNSTGKDAFTASVLRRLLDGAQLNCLYLDIVGGKVMRSYSHGFRHTQAALVAAVRLLGRKLEKHTTNSGDDHRAVFPILLRQLHTSIESAITQCTQLEEEAFSESHLWVLFVGTFFEISRIRGKAIEPQFSHTSFSQRLVLQARITRVTTWPTMEKIAERFFFVPFLEPHPSEWYESLLRPTCLDAIQ